MSKSFENKVTVFRVSRYSTTSMGNPVYAFHTDNGTYKTQSNSGRAYALENDFQLGATLDMEVTLICTAAGRVTDWKL